MSGQRKGRTSRKTCQPTPSRQLPATAKKWVGSGWKMSKDVDDAIVFAEELSAYIGSHDEWRFVSPFVMASAVYLREVASILSSVGVLVAAQNVYWEDKAEITGEVSARMIRQAGADMTLVGHVDRRTHFNETDDIVNLKTLACLDAKITPIICVGEPETERGFGSQDLFVRRQVRIALRQVPEERLEDIAILYEPNWSIGRDGIVPRVDYVRAQVEVIRTELDHEYGEGANRHVPVLYGGSVDESNASDFMAGAKIDGLGIGRASREAAQFIGILKRLESSLAEGSVVAEDYGIDKAKKEGK